MSFYENGVLLDKKPKDAQPGGKDWWLIKEKGRGGYIYLGEAHFPRSFIGKKVHIFVVEVRE
jgi:hypothetical protein